MAVFVVKNAPSLESMFNFLLAPAHVTDYFFTGASLWKGCIIRFPSAPSQTTLKRDNRRYTRQMEHVVLIMAIQSVTLTARSTLGLVARYVNFPFVKTYLMRCSNTAGAVILLITAELAAYPAAQDPLLHHLELVLLLDRMECVVL